MASFYKLVDAANRQELIALGLMDVKAVCRPVGVKSAIRAVYTGIRRAPKKGEWYLSGYVLYSLSVGGRYQTRDRMSLSLTGTKRKSCPKLLAS